MGKFFGVKFQPWGAVEVARFVGNAGRVVAAVGAVLAVVAQIAEDRQQERHRLQLRDACDGVRAAYRDVALSVEEAVWKQFDAFLADFYGSELRAVDEAAFFYGIAQRASELIARAQIAAADGPAGSTPPVRSPFV